MTIIGNKLGTKVHELLIKNQIENKVDFDKIRSWNNPAYIEELEAKFENFVNLLGLHSTIDEDKVSARCIIDFFLKDRFSGLDYNNFPNIRLLKNEFNYKNPLIATDIPLLSTCEHHLVPIQGNALLAYRPKKHIVGLNKLNLILEFFAKRPQLQERLTRQIFLTLGEVLQTEDIAVVINARHNCMCLNQVSNNPTIHSTYELGGVFDSDLSLKTQTLAYCGKL